MMGSNEANTQQSPNHSTVAIIGGGTAGLALGAELKRQGINDVTIFEREEIAGGIPRHCGHYPFGIREYGKLLKGPAYADRNIKTAIDMGVTIRTQTTVSKLLPSGKLELITPDGTNTHQADRVVLCTGMREASRAQRFIGGDRPLGIMTTGALQDFVYLKGHRPFSNPVILGSELVSFSAIGTCQHLGIIPQAMIEEEPQIIAHGFTRPYLAFKGVPLFTGAKSIRIIGKERVEAIEFTNSSETFERIETDGVIISGRFRPESALLRCSHLEMDAGTHGPRIDQFGQCSDPAYYCAGNLLGAAETSGWCWRDGVATAKRIAQDLRLQLNKPSSISLRSDHPDIQFIIPQQISICDRVDGMDKLKIGLNSPVKGKLTVHAGGKKLFSTIINSRPSRRLHIPMDKILSARPDTDVTLSIESGD